MVVNRADPRRGGHGPSMGTMTLVASRQLSPVLASAGKSTKLPRKLRAPTEVRLSLNEVAE